MRTKRRVIDSVRMLLTMFLLRLVLSVVPQTDEGLDLVLKIENWVVKLEV